MGTQPIIECFNQHKSCSNHKSECARVVQYNLLLPPATKLGQGYIFTGVCDSVHGGGGAW